MLFYLLAAAADPDIAQHGTPDAGELWMVAMQNVTSFPVVKFDPAKEEFVDDEQANRMRSRAMREP